MKFKKELKSLSLPEEEKSKLQDILVRVKYRNHPENISKGDIFQVRFRINVGDELSYLDSNLNKIDTDVLHVVVFS